MTTDIAMTDSDLDSLLETSLDDIEDLPEYADYIPTGVYKLHIVDAAWDTVEVDVDKKDPSKGKKDAKIARVTYAIEDVVELVKNEENVLVKPKMQFSESYFFTKDPAKTASAIKTRYKEVSATFSPKNVKEIIDGLKDMHVIATIKSVPRKGQEGQYFINTSNMKPL